MHPEQVNVFFKVAVFLISKWYDMLLLAIGFVCGWKWKTVPATSVVADATVKPESEGGIFPTAPPAEVFQAFEFGPNDFDDKEYIRRALMNRKMHILCSIAAKTGARSSFRNKEEAVERIIANCETQVCGMSVKHY